MSGAKRVGDLEIHEDIDFERRSWTIERVGWGVLLLFVVAAVFGFFGSGTFSTATATGDGLEVSYERFVRRGGATQVEVTVRDVADQVEVWFDRSYLASVQIQSMAPQPDSMEEMGERVFFVLSGQGSISFTLDLRPDQLGRKDGRVGVRDGDDVAIWHFMYP